MSKIDVNTPFPPCTTKQREYIEILAIDLQWQRLERNRRISDFLDRPIKYLDELDKNDARIVIDWMKELKQG